MEWTLLLDALAEYLLLLLEDWFDLLYLFDFEDFKEQIQQMKNMGGLSSIMDKLPGAAGDTIIAT